MQQRIDFEIDECLNWCASDTENCLSLKDMLKQSAQIKLNIIEDGDFDLMKTFTRFIIVFTPALNLTLPRKSSYIGSIVNGKLICNH
jgi:hypothetical protein